VTDAELRDAALAKFALELDHLKKTTRGLKGFSAPPPSEWGKALLARSEGLTLLGQVAPPPPPPPSPPVSWQGPITIDAAAITANGGPNFSGYFESTSASTPAVTIATSQAVTLTGGVRNLVGGRCIYVAVSAAKVTIDHCFIYGGPTVSTSHRWFEAVNYQSIVIRNCTILYTRGIQLEAGIPGSTVLLTRNRHTNIQGNGKNPPGNFVQFREAANPAIEISWNEIINEPVVSNPEDLISLYHSSNATIHDNYFQGQYDPDNDANSQNTITMEAGADNHNIYSNQLVACRSIGVFNGNNNSVHDNRNISCGTLPDGVTQLGYWSQPWFVAGGYANNHYHNNISAYANQGAYRYGDLSGCFEGDLGERANNTYILAPTRQMETDERTLWQQKLAAAGVTVGA